MSSQQNSRKQSIAQQVFTKNKNQQQNTFVQQYDDINDELQSLLTQENLEINSIVPGLNQVINMKFRSEDKQMHQQIQEIIKYAQKLENIVKYKNKEIQRLQYLIKYFQMAYEKRDQMLAHIQEENRNLQAKLNLIQTFQQKNQKNDNELESQTNNFTQQNVFNSQMTENNGQQYEKFNEFTNSNNPSTVPNQKRIKIQFHKKTHSSQNNTPNSSILKRFSQHTQPDLNLGSKRSLKTDQFLSNNNSTQIISMKQSKQSQSTRNLLQQSNIKNIKVEDRPQTLLYIDIHENIGNLYLEKEVVQYFKEICLNEEEFMKTLEEMNEHTLINFYENVSILLFEHKSQFSLIFNLRRMLQCSIDLNTNMSQDQAIDLIVTKSQQILNFDRASIFLFDPVKEQLWTKIAKGSSKIISIDFKQGIVGQSFTNGQTINILNAYNDPRFNQEVDKLNYYKTYTILCSPIIDKQNNIIGVLQCINKIKGYFTVDDEGIIKVLCKIAGGAITDTETYDETIQIQNNLRQIMKFGLIISQQLTYEDLILKVEFWLREKFQILKSRVLLLEENNQSLFTFNDKKQKIVFSKEIGLAGQVLKTAQLTNITNVYENSIFNNQIDIDTACPLIIAPIKNNDNQIVGILELINAKGITGISATKKSQINQFTYESTDFFCQQINQQLINIKNFNLMIEKIKK